MGSSSTAPPSGSGGDTGGGAQGKEDNQPGTIFHAAKVGDSDFIQAEILNGVDVNTRDGKGERYDVIGSCDICVTMMLTVGCILCLL